MDSLKYRKNSIASQVNILKFRVLISFITSYFISINAITSSACELYQADSKLPLIGRGVYAGLSSNP